MVDASVSTSDKSAEQSLDELLRATHEASPGELPVALHRYAEARNTGRAVSYLIDLPQRPLMPLDEDEPRLELDDSPAGFTFRSRPRPRPRSAPNRDKELERPSEPPLGLPARLADAPRQVHETALESGDRVLPYTDEAVESRDEGGEQFGRERFAGHIIRSTAAGENAPEVLRLLIHAILDHRHGELGDDATMLMIEWRPPDP
ncbi:SpoIIE family protein phosphatase [Streptomyces sp. PRKS01-29]|nr:SpoIIE family protein phosphatase [Streptomyces sabulosicollis]MBI0294701.1 SpoIIE family protein phosphatase [Streptomyces sabulosicollis]